MKNKTLIALLLLSSSASADIYNPVGFIGQTILGATEGAPLTVDSNFGLVSGLPATTYVGLSTNITVATSASYATMTGLSITPSVTGTYQVHCRIGSILHSTNNADILLAVHNNGTIVSDSIALARPFIQGGVTPSLSVPMTMYTNTEISVTGGQAVTCGWRTSAGTAQSNNSRSIMITRVR